MRNANKTSSNVLIHNVLGEHPIITACIRAQTYISTDHSAQSYLVEPTDDTNHILNESHLAPVASYPRVITVN